MNKKLLIANWKMNPSSLEKAKKLFGSIKKKIPNSRKTEVVICPPFVFLSDLIKFGRTKKYIKFGAQDVYWEKKGSFTGEISVDSLDDIGASFVIVGHSERRAMGETDEMINKKVHAVLRAGLNPILCIGESERDHDGEYLSFLREQIKTGLKGVRLKELPKVTVAYEPIWAIGKSSKGAMNPVLLHQMVIFVKKTLNELYKHGGALKARVIYGGSVAPENAEELLNEGKAEGFLVGHESLEAESFVKIFNAF